jgi:hypothetical protein
MIFYTNFRALQILSLNNNLVLEICKKRDIESQMFGCSLASSFFVQMVLSTNVFYIYKSLNKEMIRNTWVYYV